MSETVARIRIELEGTDPLVWRELDLPLSTTLAALHDIIQVAMRWQDYHRHEFLVGDKIYDVPDPKTNSSSAKFTSPGASTSPR